jgi:DUF4097 and DUF4098 domain-containing protein YvlB
MSEQRFSTPRPVRLEVTIAAGDIQVATVDGDESTVRLEGTQKIIDATKVELVGDRLVVQQRRGGLSNLFGRFDESFKARIHVPHGTDVEILTASADSTIDGRIAELNVKSASGKFLVSGDVAGSVTAKTVSGDVRIPSVNGDLLVQTVSGDVAAQSVEGSVTAKSVSGDVRVAALRDGKVNVQSVSGDVGLGIASGTSVDVDAGTASGHLSSEMPLSDAPGPNPGPTVVVRGNTVSGDIRLFRAA